MLTLILISTYCIYTESAKFSPLFQEKSRENPLKDPPSSKKDVLPTVETPVEGLSDMKEIGFLSDGFSRVSRDMKRTLKDLARTQRGTMTAIRDEKEKMVQQKERYRDKLQRRTKELAERFQDRARRLRNAVGDWASSAKNRLVQAGVHGAAFVKNAYSKSTSGASDAFDSSRDFASGAMSGAGGHLSRLRSFLPLTEENVANEDKPSEQETMFVYEAPLREDEELVATPISKHSTRFPTISFLVFVVGLYAFALWRRKVQLDPLQSNLLEEEI